MIHFTDSGETDRFPILFIHGLGENLLTWQKVLNNLPRGEYRYILIDLPGHGQSEAVRKGKYAHRHLALQLVEFLDSLSLNQAIVVGHSLGGTLAIRMALYHPEKVRALFLVSPAVFSVHGIPLSKLIFANPLLRTATIALANRTLRSKNKLIETLREAVYDPTVVDEDLVNRIVTPILDNPQSGLALYYYVRDSSRNHVFPELNNLNLPVYITNGKEDPWVRVSETQRLAEYIPNAVFLEIPQCGHMPQEEIPSELAKHLIQFIKLHARQTNARSD